MSCKETYYTLSDEAIEYLDKKATKGTMLKYNNFAITTTMFGQQSKVAREAFVDLFSADAEVSSKAADTLNETIVDSISNEYRADIQASVKGLLRESSNIRESLQMLNKDGTKTADELVDTSLSMTLVLDAIATEVEVRAKAGLSDSSTETLTSGGTTTSAERLYTVVGRELAKAKGEFYKGGDVFNMWNYRRKGKKAIDKLASEGLINVSNGKWVADGILNGHSGKLQQTVSGQDKLISGPVIRVNQDVFSTAEVEGTFKTTSGAGVTQSELLATLKQLKRLTTSFKESPVHTEVVKEVKSAVVSDDTTRDTRRRNQEGAATLAPGIKPFMEVLVKMYRDNKDTASFKQKLFIKFNISDGDEFMTKMFGTAELLDDIFDAGERGREISRMGPLIGVMQHYDKVGADEFFFSYTQANNVRLFQNETDVTFQSDKQAMRNILEAAVPAVFDTKDSIHDLVKRIAVETGVPYDVITGKEKGYDWLEESLEMLNDTSEEGAIELMAILVNKADGNPWKNHKTIRAIRDVRLGIKGNKITTGVLLESDATASGGVLKMLQNLHAGPVRDALTRLGLFRDDGTVTDDSIDDFYAIGLEQYAKLKDKSVKYRTQYGKQIAYTEKMMELSDVKDMRTFLKDPIIRFLYSQSSTANAQETGVVIATKIVQQGFGKIDEAIAYLDLKTKVDGKVVKRTPYGKALTKDQQLEALEVLSKAIGNSVGKFLVKDVIDKAYQEPMFEAGKDNIDGAFAAIQATIREKDVGVTFKYMDPTVVLNWLDDNPTKTYKDFPYTEFATNRVIGDKKKEVMFDNEGTRVIQKVWAANPGSAHVLPIHSMDATILLRALKRLYSKLDSDAGISGLSTKEANELRSNLNKETLVLLVHDATYLSPKFASVIEEAYNQEIINVSMNYDVVNMMLQEALFKHNELAAESGVAPITLDKLPEMLKSKITSSKDYRKLVEAVKNNDERLAEKVKLLNVKTDGTPRTEHSDEFRVSTNFFSNDISDSVMVDIAKEYEANRLETDNPKVVKKKVAKKLPTTKSEDTLNRDDYKEYTKEANRLQDLVDSGKEYVVLDTETTGKPSDNGAVVHQIAYSTKDGGTIVIDLPLSEEAESALRGNAKVKGNTFVEFYSTHNKVDSSIDAVVKHIQGKALRGEELSNAIDALNTILEGTPIVAHNAPFDINMLSKDDRITNIASGNVYDTLKAAYSVEKDSIEADRYKSGTTREGVKVTPVKYVGGVTKQGVLAKTYRVKEDGSHTAAGDVNTLKEIIPAMMNKHKLATTITLEEAVKIDPNVVIGEDIVGNDDKVRTVVEGNNIDIDKVHSVKFTVSSKHKNLLTSFNKKATPKQQKDMMAALEKLNCKGK